MGSMSTRPLTTRSATVSVASILCGAYERFERRPALVAGDAVRTYGELGERVRRGVDALHGLGARRGDRMVFVAANSPEYIEASHVAFVGGFARVALSSRLHPREVAEIVEDCGARILVVGTEWLEPLRALDDALGSVEIVIVLGEGASGAIGWEALLAAGVPGSGHPLPGPDDLCALLYTSGTTGRPKGAMLPHSSWVAMIRNSLVELPSVGDDDVILHVAPLSHFSGYVEPTYSSRGALHVVDAPFDPARAVMSIARHGVTAMPLVPTMLNMLVPAAEHLRDDVTTMRTIVYGGSSISPDRLARAIDVFGEVFVQFFGLSETPMPLSALAARDHRLGADGSVPARLASAGRVNPFVELHLRGDDGGDVAAGEVGEIVVRGDSVMAGYWERPEQTAEMIDEDGWAATGDLGRFDDEGYLYIVDRKKDMIVSGGYNVYPTELENAISTLDAVQEVAVVGVPDEQWGESIMAVVVRRAGSELTGQAVVEACTDRLAGYKKPRRVLFVDELPKTGSGKVMRRAIRDGLSPARRA
jgi:long-chain acyl-CoA synthetase